MRIRSGLHSLALAPLSVGLLAVLIVIAAAAAIGARPGGNLRRAAAAPDIVVSLDMDTTDGGPCTHIDSSTSHNVGDSYSVAICVQGLYLGLPIGQLSFDVLYDDTLNRAPEITDAGPGLDDNPDVNAGLTTWGEGLGDGWDCSNVPGSDYPKGDENAATGPGQGQAHIACWSLAGPFTLGDDETIAVIAVINFTAIAGGATDTLTIANGFLADADQNEMGTCNTEYMTCNGGADTKFGTPPPTLTPTPTPTVTPWCGEPDQPPCPTSTPTPTLEPGATPAPGHEVIAIHPSLCHALTASKDWNGDTVVDVNDAVTAFFTCYSLGDESNLRKLVTVLGGDPDNPQPEDFAPIDQDANQLHEQDGALFIISFVPNDSPVAFYADKGEFQGYGSSIACGPGEPPDFQFTEEDCDDDGDRGDGVVVARLTAGGAPRGPATALVRQASSQVSLGYTIVGEPWSVELSAVKTAVRVGAVTCKLWSDVPTLGATLNSPQKTPLLASVTDSDGTLLTAAWVAFETDDQQKAIVALPLVPTLDMGYLGIAAPNVLCGQVDGGTVTITGSIVKGPPGVNVDPAAGEDSATLQISVVSPTETYTPTPTPTLEPGATPAPGHEIIAIHPSLCQALTASKDWNGDTVVDMNDAVTAFFTCYSLGDESNLRNLVTVLGGDPDGPRPEDFALIDVDANQLHEQDGALFIISFVPNDNPVAFYANEGVFAGSGRSDILCGPTAMLGYDIGDEDCDDDGDRGDGAVAAMLMGGGASRGPATALVRQAASQVSLGYTIVGEPWNIELSAMKTAVQVGAVTCELWSDGPTFMATLNSPEKTPLFAKVTDSDGTVLTAAWVAFEADDQHKAIVALPVAPTLYMGDLDIIAGPNVLCGQVDTGTVTITASIVKGPPGVNFDPAAHEDSATLQISVVSPTETSTPTPTETYTPTPTFTPMPTDTPTPTPTFTPTPTPTATRTPTASPTPPSDCRGDVNGDGHVNSRDVIAVTKALLTRPGDRRWNPAADVNGDLQVDLRDLVIVARSLVEGGCR